MAPKKETLAVAKHGLHSDRKKLNLKPLDGRRTEARAHAMVNSKFEEDLGPLNFGQKILVDEIFWALWILSGFRKTLLDAGKDSSLLALITNERWARTYGAMKNGMIRDLTVLYGGNLAKAEKKMETLEEYVREKYGEAEETDQQNGSPK